jgi:hypothetical protein
MVKCVQCGNELDPANESIRIASMSGSIMGDEYTDIYYFCGACGVYTVQSWYEPFLGEESSTSHGPVSREEGDEAVALIRQCCEPWNKKCRCQAHRTYFKGQLD